MSDIRSKLREIYSLETLASGCGPVHRLHPLAKLAVCVFFVVTVVSFPRESFERLVPYIFYPTLLIAVSGTPFGFMLKRFAVALPFCALAGLSNVFFDTAPLFYIGSFAVTHGAAAFFTIIYKSYLCVTAVLLLIAVTPFSELSAALRAIRVPAMLVTLFEMTYRYIGTLLDEAFSMRTAYLLRANGKGLDMRHMGSFFGQLLLRSFDRAERVYSAMKCRGYALRGVRLKSRVPRKSDFLYALGVCSACIILRLWDWGSYF